MDKKLKDAILNADHTQASVARELGVTAQAVNQWTMGKVPWQNVAKLSRLIKIPKSQLLEGM